MTPLCGKVPAAGCCGFGLGCWAKLGPTPAWLSAVWRVVRCDSIQITSFTRPYKAFSKTLVWKCLVKGSATRVNVKTFGLYRVAASKQPGIRSTGTDATHIGNFHTNQDLKQGNLDDLGVGRNVAVKANNQRHLAADV
jgi:hypothetical protein